MKITSLRDRIKKQKSPYSKAIYQTFKALQNINVKVPMFLAGFFYNEKSFRQHTWKWIINKFYFEPMMRYRCNEVGKNLKTDGDMPLIIGSGNITIGNNVKFGNRCAIYVSENLFKTPQLIIGDNTVINYQCGISVEKKVVIGNNCVIAGETMIFDNNSHGIKYENGRKMTEDDVAPIKIEDYVWIGMRSIILKGVTIGKGAVVAAGSVVTQNVPSMTVVGGNPAQVLKQIDS